VRSPAALTACLAWAVFCGAPQQEGPTIRLELSWELRPDMVFHSVELIGDGAEFRTFRVEGYAPVAEEPLLFDGKKLRGEVAGLFEELKKLPRIAHTPSTASGVKVLLHVEKSGERSLTCPWLFNYYHPALEKLYRATGSAVGEKAAAAIEPLLQLVKFQGQKTWEFTPGVTPKERLLEPLDPPCPDVELRRIASGLIGDGGHCEFIPKLRELFVRSKRQDPEGDYFLALALLRLGELDGVELVLAIGQSAHPEWAIEASKALSQAFGREVLPSHDFRSPGDPRPAAAEKFLRWLRENREKLQFDKETKKFLVPGT